MVPRRMGARGRAGGAGGSLGEPRAARQLMQLKTNVEPIIKARGLTAFGQFRLLLANEKFPVSLANARSQLGLLYLIPPALHTSTTSTTSTHDHLRPTYFIRIGIPTV